MSLHRISDPIEAAQAVVRGALCAIPTETVYGLGASAQLPHAIGRVFEAKGRPRTHPLIVHVSSRNQLPRWGVDIPDWVDPLVREFWPGPLTVVVKRSDLAIDDVTGGQDTVAVRVPNHLLTLELLRDIEGLDLPGLVAPSANRFGHVSPTKPEHVLADLGDYLAAHNDYLLDGGACSVGVESTIVLATSETPAVLRPGAVTRKMIQQVTGRTVADSIDSAPRVPGTLAAHYAPDAQVVILANADDVEKLPAGVGLIALREIATPSRVHRLAAPIDDAEFAQQLYDALRTADAQGLPQVYVVCPSGAELAEAIRDRLQRAAH